MCRRGEGESKKLQAMMRRGRRLLKPKLKELRRVGAACGDDADDAGTGRLFCLNGQLQVLQPWQLNAFFFASIRPLFLLEPLSILAGTSDCHGYEYRIIIFSFLLGLQFLVWPARKFASTRHYFCWKHHDFLLPPCFVLFLAGASLNFATTVIQFC